MILELTYSQIKWSDRGRVRTIFDAHVAVNGTYCAIYESKKLFKAIVLAKINGSGNNIHR